MSSCLHDKHEFGYTPPFRMAVDGRCNTAVASLPGHRVLRRWPILRLAEIFRIKVCADCKRICHAGYVQELWNVPDWQACAHLVSKIPAWSYYWECTKTWRATGILGHMNPCDLFHVCPSYSMFVTFLANRIRRLARFEVRMNAMRRAATRPAIFAATRRPCWHERTIKES